MLCCARFDLGDKAPQISGIKVYQGERIDDEVNVEIDLMWSGKQARSCKSEKTNRLTNKTNSNAAADQSSD